MTVRAATTGPDEAIAAPGVAGAIPPQDTGRDPAPSDTAPSATAPGDTRPGDTAPGGTDRRGGPDGQTAPDGQTVPSAADRGAADRGDLEQAPRRPSLSPSRAADFKTCPLLYRFRSIDRLPERPTPDQLRGTLVHAVLDRLFDLPAADRVAQRAAELVEPEWRRMAEEQADLLDIFAAAPAAGQAAGTAPADPPAGPTGGANPADPAATQAAGANPVDPMTGQAAGANPVDPAAGQAGGAAPADPPAGPRSVAVTVEEFLAGARELLGGYFSVEDPRRLAPAERECLVSVEVDDGRLLLRGYIDRLDESPAGDLRVVDYKTGGAPREAFEARALFQLKFYALVLWRTRGVVPKVLRLLYLKDAEICDYTPEVDELDRFERTLIALWAAIDRATQERDFRPKPSRLCGWCAHQALCPAYGGTPPPFPQLVAAPSVEPPGPMDD
jgi:putative RecB family exonuclease